LYFSCIGLRFLLRILQLNYNVLFGDWLVLLDCGDVVSEPFIEISFVSLYELFGLVVDGCQHLFGSVDLLVVQPDEAFFSDCTCEFVVVDHFIDGGLDCRFAEFEFRGEVSQ
jgi:hypothetical protein